MLRQIEKRVQNGQSFATKYFIFQKKKIECKNLLKIADVNLIKQLPQYPY